MMTIRLSLISLLAWIVSACAGPALSGVTPTIEPTAPLLRMTPTAAPSSTQEVNTGKPLREPSPTPAITPTPLSLPLPADTACRADAAQATDLGKLAYVQGGDIWIKSLSNGKPLRLTTDGHNREPHWSPSSQWLAFRKGDQVWTLRVDGSVALKLNNGAPVGAFAWSPATDRIAYVTEVGELVTINADGSNRRTVVASSSDRPGTGVSSMAWSPDGQWLAYAWEEILKQNQPPPPDRYASLGRARADGGKAIELINAGRPSDYGFIVAGWSSDAQHILFWIDPVFSSSITADGVPLFAVPVQGGAQKQLTKPVLVHSDFVVPGPGKIDQLAVIVGGYRGVWENKTLHILSADEDVTLTPAGMSASSPDWSPDGQRLAYVVMPDRGDLAGGETARQGMLQRRIVVVNMQGERRQLTDDLAYRDERPLWSADGCHILFARLNSEDQASLWLIQAVGGKPQQVVNELTPAPGWFGHYGYIDWNDLFGWWRGPGAVTP